MQTVHSAVRAQQPLCKAERPWCISTARMGTGTPHFSSMSNISKQDWTNMTKLILEQQRWINRPLKSSSKYCISAARECTRVCPEPTWAHSWRRRCTGAAGFGYCKSPFPGSPAIRIPRAWPTYGTGPSLLDLLYTLRKGGRDRNNACRNTQHVTLVLNTPASELLLRRCALKHLWTRDVLNFGKIHPF